MVIHHLPTQDPVHQITIVPRGRAGGMTICSARGGPDATSPSSEMVEHIAVLSGRPGGRAAGAGRYLHRRLQRHRAGHQAIARDMVGHVRHERQAGQRGLRRRHDEVFIGRVHGTDPVLLRERRRRRCDEEIQAPSSTSAYAQLPPAILTAEPASSWWQVAEYLLANETMDAETFESYFTVSRHRRNEKGPRKNENKKRPCGARRASFVQIARAEGLIIGKNNRALGKMTKSVSASGGQMSGKYAGK